MTEPIGRVLCGGGSVVATLNGVDDWTVTVNGQPDLVMAKNLRIRYEDTYKGPSNGYYGQLILEDLAKTTGGFAFVREFPPTGPDEVP